MAENKQLGVRTGENGWLRFCMNGRCDLLGNDLSRGLHIDFVYLIEEFC